MSYSINGKIYTSHALMDEIVYNTKSIMRNIILKNEKLADSYETEESMHQADLFVACKNGTMELSFFPLTREILVEYGCSELQAAKWVEDYTRIPEELRDEVLAFCCNNFIDNYVETNNYYRMINGQPEYNPEHPDDYGITLSKYDYYTEDGLKFNKFDDLFEKDLSGTEFDFDIPLHELPLNQINTLEAIGVLPAIRELEIDSKTDISTKTVIDPNGKVRTVEDQAYHYKYLNYLGEKQVDIYNARIAKNWEILYLPSAEYLVQDRFVELYNINRDIYERRTYQLAYQESSEYFEEMIVLLIIGQTFADMITDSPEWFIRRDVFDLRTVKYFITSQGVKFFEDIPMRYQIRIVKNLNKLIKYKSTDKNIHDILEIFNLDGVVVYKYFLFKKYLYTDNSESDFEEKEENPEWSMEAEYDFGFEDTDNIGNTGDGQGGDVPGSELYDFVDLDDEGYVDPEPDRLYYYDFRSEDPDYWDEYWTDDSQIPEDESFDFGFEDDYPNIIINTAEDGYEDYVNNQLLDFGLFDPYIIEDYDERVIVYDFNNESGFEVRSTEATDRITDYQERIKKIKDEFNNVYELEFFKTPIGENWDDYVYDKFYREPYDLITQSDKYWDGNDTHNYVRNMHLRKDFTIEGTKYIGIEYNVDMAESMYEKEYYLGMLLNARLDTDAVTLSIPQLSTKRFSLINILLFVYCLNGIYTNTNIPVQDATEAVTSRTEESPDFDPYVDFDGGFPWTDPAPPTPDPEPVPLYGYEDYGFEDEDDIDPDTIEVIKDYGYNFSIDWNSVVYDNYDYGFITPDSEDDEYSPQPVPQPAYITPEFDYAYDDYVLVKPERPYEYCGQYYVDQTNGDYIQITKEFIDSHPEFIGERITIVFKWTLFTDPEEFGYYDEDLDNHRAGNWDDINQWEYELDGGHEPYSGRLTAGSYFDYLRSRHQDIYVDAAGRIYGFNMSNKLEDIAEAIGFRHSEFGFERGYTLEECCVDTFISKTKFDDIEDFYRVYQNNITCYKNLIFKMQNANSRDERRVLEYVFMKLFTLPWDTEFYILRNGDMAVTYDQLLKERDYTLYSIYLSLLNEGDSSLRIFNTRNVLNNIADTLNYFIHGDNLQYILSFISTMSFDALLHYVFEMVNFFKSWKTHFLDPILSYIIDDKNESIAIYGDKIQELKIKYWTTYNAKANDSVTITPLYYFNEELGYDSNNAVANSEITDIASHYVDDDILDDKVYDCGSPNGDDIESILDGGGVHSLSDAELSYAVSNNINVTNEDCIPYYQRDCGRVGDELDVYDIDGGGAIDAPTYLDIDGLELDDPNNMVPRPFNDYNYVEGYETSVGYDIEGGRANIHYIRENGIVTDIDIYNQITSNVTASSYYTNGLTVEEDGIYFTKSVYAIDENVEEQIELADEYNTTIMLFMESIMKVALALNPDNFATLMFDYISPKFESFNYIRRTLDDEYINNLNNIGAELVQALNSWFTIAYTEKYANVWSELEEPAEPVITTHPAGTVDGEELYEVNNNEVLGILSY